MELPNEICREIGSYLDYESRMNYNRVMEFEDRFVRKLNSDSHNAWVKASLVLRQINKLETLCVICKRIQFQKIMYYLAETKDEILFKIESVRKAVKDRCEYLLEAISDPLTGLNRRQRKYIAIYSNKVLEKLKTIKASDIKNKLVEV